MNAKSLWLCRDRALVPAAAPAASPGGGRDRGVVPCSGSPQGTWGHGQGFASPRVWSFKLRREPSLFLLLSFPSWLCPFVFPPASAWPSVLLFTGHPRAEGRG